MTLAAKRFRGCAREGTLREVVSVRMGGPAADAWRSAPPQFRAVLTAKLEKAALASIMKAVRVKPLAARFRKVFLRDPFFPG